MRPPFCFCKVRAGFSKASGFWQNNLFVYERTFKPKLGLRCFDCEFYVCVQMPRCHLMSLFKKLRCPLMWYSGLISSHCCWTDCFVANSISIGVEPLCSFSAWNFCWCIVNSVDFLGQCMKFNPLALAEQRGDSEFVLTRIETTCAQNRFACTFWTWFPLSVTLQSFLSTRDRAILSRTNSVICLDSTGVALALTEQRESISVDCWEVPTPRVAAWSSPEEPPN